MVFKKEKMGTPDGKSTSVPLKKILPVAFAGMTVLSLSSYAKSEPRWKIKEWDHKSEMLYFEDPNTKKIYPTSIKNIYISDFKQLQNFKYHPLNEGSENVDFIRQEILENGIGRLSLSIRVKKEDLENDYKSQKKAITKSIGLWRKFNSGQTPTKQAKSILIDLNYQNRLMATFQEKKAQAIQLEQHVVELQLLEEKLKIREKTIEVLKKQVAELRVSKGPALPSKAKLTSKTTLPIKSENILQKIQDGIVAIPSNDFNALAILLSVAAIVDNRRKKNTGNLPNNTNNVIMNNVFVFPQADLRN